MSDPIVLSVEHHVATLTLNRPDVLNTLDVAMAKALAHTTRELGANDNVRCVRVQGAGTHFMAGGDIGYFRRALETNPVERQSAIGGPNWGWVTSQVCIRSEPRAKQKAATSRKTNT